MWRKRSAGTLWSDALTDGAAYVTVLQPKAEGVNLMLWIVPPLVLAAGLLGLARALRRGRTAPPGPTAPQGDDDYLRRVRADR